MSQTAAAQSLKLSQRQSQVIHRLVHFLIKPKTNIAKNVFHERHWTFNLIPKYKVVEQSVIRKCVVALQVQYLETNFINLLLDTAEHTPGTVSLFSNDIIVHYGNSLT